MLGRGIKDDADNGFGEDGDMTMTVTVTMMIVTMMMVTMMPLFAHSHHHCAGIWWISLHLAHKSIRW